MMSSRALLHVNPLIRSFQALTALAWTCKSLSGSSGTDKVFILAWDVPVHQM